MTYFTRILTDLEHCIAAITAHRDYSDRNDGWQAWYWYASRGEW